MNTKINHKKIEPILLTIDELSKSCGFFHPGSIVNGGYRCDHPECEDYDLIYVNGDREKYIDSYVPAQILAMSMTKRNIKCNRRLAKKFIKKARKLINDRDNEKLKKYGMKCQGKCYSFTCPLASEADREDIEKYDPDLFESDYRDYPDDQPYDYVIQHSIAK